MLLLLLLGSGGRPGQLDLERAAGGVGGGLSPGRVHLVQVLEELGQPVLCRLVLLEAGGEGVILELVRQTLAQGLARSGGRNENLTKKTIN